MAALKIYLDEDVHPYIAHALRLRGWEALTTVEAAQRSATDEEQLQFATDRGYAILTYNSSDFPRLHSEWKATGKAHAGIIVATQDDPRRNIRALLNLVSSTSGESIRNSLVYLNNWA